MCIKQRKTQKSFLRLGKQRKQRITVLQNFLNTPLKVTCLKQFLQHSLFLAENIFHRNYETAPLIMFRKNNLFSCASHMRHASTLRGEMADFMDVKADGT